MESVKTAQMGFPEVVAVTKVRYCLYARKSTEDSSEKQALSIESQVKEMRAIAERDGLEIVDIRRESHSAKDSGQRPVFEELLADIGRGRYTGILTWAPDRLSRNAGDLGSVVDLMDQHSLIEIRTYGQSFKNSPNEKFLLMILCSQAKLENDNKSINVKRGLRTRCEMGLRPGPPIMGYLNEKRMDKKCQVIIDVDRAPIIKKMFEKVVYEKWSGRKVYHWLKFDLNFKTPKGNKGLTLSNIYQVLQNPFYYGVFEYPVKSGNWYTGQHEPLISKELFDQVQTQIKSQFVRSENKEFAFTKLMSCGLCDSGVCADEKFKKQKNGNVHRHVYYGCTKAKDSKCKCGYINEPDLLKQFEELMDTIDIDEIGIKEKIKGEVERFKKFQQLIVGSTEKIKVVDVDIRNYAKYILREGQDVEKRELLGCLKGKILLTEKVISLS
jgi:DNA invertase Pin-like site-specific DNA recombinase